ncbi:MAG: iron-containing redox enzyme family protein [Panacagrimonas sp.]
MNPAFKACFDPARQDSVVDLDGALHRRLAGFNSRRLRPAVVDERWKEALQRDLQLSLLEGQFIESERRALQVQANAAPTDPESFMHWFAALREGGPGQNDPLFDWLATAATLPEMCWFLEQEVAGEAGFDDLVALTQLRMPMQPKLEMARNYWDELGRGHALRMHGEMLKRTITELQLAPGIESVVWEALALANLMQGLATNRRYAYHSVGALGAVELTAPTRVNRIDQGLERLGVSPQGRSYFKLHASLDIKHSRDWNAEVIRPLIDGRPDVRRAIAEGALMRLSAGARCFERYRRALSVPMPSYPSAARRDSPLRASLSPISFR